MRTLFRTGLLAALPALLLAHEGHGVPDLGGFLGELLHQVSSPQHLALIIGLGVVLVALFAGRRSVQKHHRR